VKHRSRRRPITLRDVAARAEVSLSTASRVLNGGHYASQEAIERVHAAVAELDYRANEGARSLRRAQTMTVGVVFHQLRNPSVLDLLEGIEAGCDERGYSVLVTSAQDSPERYESLIRRLMERRVDAILLSNPQESAEREIELARTAGVPVIALSTRRAALDHVPMVHAPSRELLDEVMQTLVKLGHQRMAFVGGIRGVTRSGFPGLDEAAAKYGIQLIEEPPQDYGEQSTLAVLDQLLARRDRPTTIMLLARNLPATLARLTDRGFRVPEDISVVSFNDSSSNATRGLVAEIHVDSRQVGYTASQVAVDWIEGHEPENRLALDIAEWVPGSSIGPAPQWSVSEPATLESVAS